VLRLSVTTNLKAPFAIESALYILHVLSIPSRIMRQDELSAASMESSDGGHRIKGKGKPERTANKISHTAVSVLSVSLSISGIAITHEMLLRTLASKMSDSPVRERHRDNEQIPVSQWTMITQKLLPIEDTSTKIEQAIIERALQKDNLSPASQWIGTEHELVSKTLAPEGELSTIERERGVPARW
jgi:hypothetical protein